MPRQVYLLLARLNRHRRWKGLSVNAFQSLPDTCCRRATPASSFHQNLFPWSRVTKTLARLPLNLTIPSPLPVALTTKTVSVTALSTPTTFLAPPHHGWLLYTYETLLYLLLPCLFSQNKTDLRPGSPPGYNTNHDGLTLNHPPSICSSLLVSSGASSPHADHRASPCFVPFRGGGKRLPGELHQEIPEVSRGHRRGDDGH
ncbi:unnamed protein product, partial [Ectocarpus sp. 8 AP-2014]